MTETVDNIELDKENVEFNNAAEFVRHTDKLVYLTGKAGTGKTTFLKYIKDTTNKNTVILAPTGVAAINAGGVTIHSFFQIPFGPFVPDDSRLRTTATGTENRETIYTTFRYKDDKREIIENLELLIIDEISMVRADMLDVIDRILKVFRKKPYLPFGGVQVILIGDTFQLPPIADNEQWSILSQFYKTPFFFSSKIIEQNTPLYIELKKIYRQNEQEFIDLLNRVRVSQVNANDFSVLNAKYNPTFSGNGSDYIILATHNNIVNETNLTKLNQLTTELFTYEANVTGTFPDKHKPTDHYLKLKVGAQIMFIKNDTGEYKRYYNGKIGKIKELEEATITVVFDDESEVEVERAVWNNIQYSYNREQKKIVEEIVGTFEQFPIRLAWAITVHKSQGLTFEKVIADLGRAFAPGQVYVALSRCTSFSGLMLKTQLNSYAIKTDPRVIEFAQNETPGTLITEQLNTGKADFYYKKAREDFQNGKIKSAFDLFKRALTFRNDIDTDIFKKFIEVQGKRLLDFKQKNSSLIVRLELTNNELSEAQENIESQAQELNNKSTKISEQNSSIGLLLEKTSEFENEIERLKKALKQTEKKLSDSQIHSNGLQTKLQKTESDLRNKKKEIQNNRIEIERLKNLKWYDKLIGKK
ncbi:AAA family ATPase [Aequorivita sp. 609]|uniref:DEAD/DEAH box helicase n=1 Tax=Aequorivita TaxID=153265 RepID=UPI00161871E3|nr:MULTISPECIES: DEAD/DEAH box helicase [Aequorivita]MBB6682458.1 AAA family ATPase [Aequorivita sp. 609]